MKIYVTLCLFAVFSTNVNSKPNYQHLTSETNQIVEKNGQDEILVQATDPISKDLEIIKLKVKNAIGNVESIIQQLEHVRIDTEEDTRMTVTNRWWDQMDTYQDFVNLLTASMRREVNAAKAKGKDAQHCYDTNYCGIMQHRDTANKAAIKCQESAENSIKNSLGFIDNLVSFGEVLVTELKDLVMNCHDSDRIKMHSCILIELGRINIAVRSFEDDAKYVEFNALPASNYVVLQASKCLNNVYLLAHYESEDAMLSNSRCVQEVVENKKTMIYKLVPTCELRVTSQTAQKGQKTS